MSNYKAGDKVVLTVTSMAEMGCNPYYMLNDNFIFLKQNIDKYAEPLSTYTLPLEDKVRKQEAEITRLLAEIVKLKEDFKDIEPLEAKIKRQEKEITRLLAENKELKEENKKLLCKVDSYELYGNQHEEEYNQTFNQGAEAAWELARKIVLKNGYSVDDLHEIFNFYGSHQVLENYTYQEAAAKVSEWERAKEEIKVGDVLEDIADNNVKCVVTKPHSSNMAYLVFDDGTAGMHKLDTFKKANHRMDINGFLKQIGEAE